MRAPDIGRFQHLLCALRWHRRGRSRGWYDGRETARCRSCKTKMSRKEGGWWRIDAAP